MGAIRARDFGGKVGWEAGAFQSCMGELLALAPSFLGSIQLFDKLGWRVAPKRARGAAVEGAAAKFDELIVWRTINYHRKEEGEIGSVVGRRDFALGILPFNAEPAVIVRLSVARKYWHEGTTLPNIAFDDIVEIIAGVDPAIYPHLNTRRGQSVVEAENRIPILTGVTNEYGT